MAPRFKKIAAAILSTAWVVIVAAFLSIAAGNFLRVYNLRRVQPDPQITTFSGFRPGVPAEILIWMGATVVLFFLVHNQPQRILPLSLIAVVLFLAFNLFGARHILPLDLIPPRPAVLAEGYVEALLAGDPQKALQLSGPAEACQRATLAMYDAERLLIDEAPGAESQDYSLKLGSVQTFNGRSAPDALGISRVLPQQRLEVQVRRGAAEPLIFNLEFLHTPGIGLRTICGP